MELEKILFNKPYLSGKESEYILEAVQSGKISGDGIFTKKCQYYFEQKYGFKKCLLTTSCTDALEMAAILIKIESGDEVIMPSYTFVSTANAFVLRGAKIIFCDSRKDHPGIDESCIESLITSKTKAIVAVHYAGVACDMEKIMSIASMHNLFVIEDAAQAIDSFYTFPDRTVKPLGSIGHLATFSFHETKNIISGEGGMLVVNDEQFIKRAEIIWEKGTNRSAFFKGEVDKYSWVDIGSSFLPSEIIAAFLYAQLECLSQIQSKRKEIWARYFKQLLPLEHKNHIHLPRIPKFAFNNAHMFYFLCNSSKQRCDLIAFLKSENIMSVFHYLSLHKSIYYNDLHTHGDLPLSDFYSDNLVRMPFYYELTLDAQDRIIDAIKRFFS